MSSQKNTFFKKYMIFMIIILLIVTIVSINKNLTKVNKSSKEPLFEKTLQSKNYKAILTLSQEDNIHTFEFAIDQQKNKQEIIFDNNVFYNVDYNKNIITINSKILPNNVFPDIRDIIYIVGNNNSNKKRLESAKYEYIIPTEVFKKYFMENDTEIFNPFLKFDINDINSVSEIIVTLNSNRISKIEYNINNSLNISIEFYDYNRTSLTDSKFVRTEVELPDSSLYTKRKLR